MLSAYDWHRRYTEQARWTASLRKYLFGQAGLNQARRVLEVGCGTGAILSELAELPLAAAVGVDIALPSLQLASQHAPHSVLACADAHTLPFASCSFDLVYAHFLLLWVHDPARVLLEMARLVYPGGAVLAIAEPDYGGRVDYPLPLAEVGDWQIESLRAQGANPLVGRRLATLFSQAGLTAVQVGVLGGQWAIGSDNATSREAEWAVVESDIAALPHPPNLEQVQCLHQMDAEARLRGERILFVPTFYAMGVKT